MENYQPNLWEQISNKWLSFKKAREKVWNYEFEYQEEWKLFIDGGYADKNPLLENIPANPDEIYKYTGWKNWKDWLIHPKNIKEYTLFFEARAFVRCLRLKNKTDWFNYINEDKLLHEKYNLCFPQKPYLEYKDKGWNGWDDWFGKNIDYKSYESIQKFVKSLNLKSEMEWNQYCHRKKPQCIYTYPEIAYKNKEWHGWDEWLGINLFDNSKKKTISNLPKGAKECRCKGLDVNCIDCDGKGYYFQNSAFF